MKERITRYADRIRRSSIDAHHFIRKLRYKENEPLRFILVNDSERNTRSYSNSDRKAIKLLNPPNGMEKYVTQIKLNSENNKPVHLLGQNAKGYAIFMRINYGGSKDSEIKDIRAQFIDVDINKISEHFGTIGDVKKKIRELKSDAAEPIESIKIKRKKTGEYRLLAYRTERRLSQLKKQFLHRYWKQIKNAMIVETYSGFHIYWVIRGGSINKFVPIQNALIQKFGSDPVITNLSRVMRLPGYYHMKNPDKPFLVRVIHWGRKKPFTQEELIHSLKFEYHPCRSSSLS